MDVRRKYLAWAYAKYSEDQAMVREEFDLLHLRSVSLMFLDASSSIMLPFHFPFHLLSRSNAVDYCSTSEVRLEVESLVRAVHFSIFLLPE